jgi:hypothetical protein
MAITRVLDNCKFSTRSKLSPSDKPPTTSAPNPFAARLSLFASVVAARILPSFVYFLVTARAERHEIFGGVIAQFAPCLNVVDLKILHRTARLAAPPVTLKHPSP